MNNIYNNSILPILQMNRDIANKVIDELEPRQYIRLAEANIISTTDEKIDSKKLQLFVEPDDVDIDNINLNGLREAHLNPAISFNKHTFDDNGIVINVDKIGLENMEQIREHISDIRLLNAIEAVLDVFETSQINHSLKIGIKMKCYVFLKLKISCGEAMSLKLDTLSSIINIMDNKN